MCVSVKQPPTTYSFTGAFDLIDHICIKSSFAYKCDKEILWQIDVLLSKIDAS